jgi:hypothetical protein
MIYDHFRDKLRRKWKQLVERNPDVLKMKDALQCLHDVTVDGIEQDDGDDDNGDGVVVVAARDASSGGTTPKTTPTLPRPFKEFMTLPAFGYTRVLRTRQLVRYGCNNVTNVCPD